MALWVRKSLLLVNSGNVILMTSSASDPSKRPDKERGRDRKGVLSTFFLAGLAGVPGRDGCADKQQVPHDDVLPRPLVPVERVGRGRRALDGHEERREEVRVLRPRVHVHVDRQLCGVGSIRHGQ